MNPFVSHSSVRIKGTENNYEPTTCINPNCAVSTEPHMHCPFCAKNEAFIDPVILKAHYRVKHVDKGIEFAGLKILRCCEHCNIVGTIKGTKYFKGAHWHCYKCRNGFTRRDEAIKHYRTHFRNPSTTFQIQVAQDINQATHGEGNSGDDSVIHDLPVVEPFITSTSLVEFNGETLEDKTTNEIQVSVAANETVDTCEGQTFMIIQDHCTDIVGTIETPIKPDTLKEKLRKLGAASTLSTTDNFIGWPKEKEILRERIKQLKSELTKVHHEKDQIEQKFVSEIDSLKVQLQMLSSEVAVYQRREMDLLDQLKVPVDDRVSSILAELKQQHEDLLHQQLIQLRRSYLQQHYSEHIMGQTSEQVSDHTMEIVSSQESDINMATLVTSSATGMSQVITTVPHSRVVLAGQHQYTSLSAADLPPGSIVLKSEPLLSDTGSSTPLFVVQEGTDLTHIKTDDQSDVETEQTIEHVFLEETVAEELSSAALDEDPSSSVLEPVPTADVLEHEYSKSVVSEHPEEFSDTVHVLVDTESVANSEELSEDLPDKELALPISVTKPVHDSATTFHLEIIPGKRKAVGLEPEDNRKIQKTKEN